MVFTKALAKKLQKGKKAYSPFDAGYRKGKKDLLEDIKDQEKYGGVVGKAPPVIKILRKNVA